MAESTEIPYGYCECGCGEKTRLASQTDTLKGYVKGEPVRYVPGHHWRHRRAEVALLNVTGLCMCGCGERTPPADRTRSDRGVVKDEPVPYICGHNSRKAPPALPTVAGEHYAIADSGCWLWQRALQREGYGQTNVGGSTARAHRVVYERHRGPIPDGLHLHHTCGVKRCVNPDHLEPMTPEEHSRLHKDEPWAHMGHRQVAA